MADETGHTIGSRINDADAKEFELIPDKIKELGLQSILDPTGLGAEEQELVSENRADFLALFKREEVEAAMRNMLENDPVAQCEFIDSGVDTANLPRTVDEKRFINKGYTTEEIARIQIALKTAAKYFTFPIIKDIFEGDSGARTQWEKTLPPELWDFIKQKSKLARNMPFSALLPLQRIQRLVQKKEDTDTLDEINRILEMYPDEKIGTAQAYDQLSFEEKCGATDDVHSMIIAALKFFCEKKDS